MIADHGNLVAGKRACPYRCDSAGEAVADPPFQGPNSNSHGYDDPDRGDEKVEPCQGPCDLLGSRDHQYAPEEVKTALNVFARIVMSCSTDQLST